MKLILIIVLFIQTLASGYNKNVCAYPLTSANISAKRNLSGEGIPIQTANFHYQVTKEL